MKRASMNSQKVKSSDPADERLDRMLEISEALGVPLDHVVKHMGRCDQSTFLALSDNPSRLPRYTQSRDKP